MSHLPMLPAGILRPIVDHVDRLGCPRSPRAERLAAKLDDPSLLVPYTALSGLFEDLLAAGAGDDVGLRAGEAARLDRLGTWGERLRRVPTIAAGVDLALRQRHNSAERFTLSRRGPDLCLHRHISASVQEARAQERDFALMIELQVFRLAAGPAWRPLELHLEGPRPSYAGELAALAERGVRFGASQTTVVFPATLMECPLARPGPGAVVAGAPSPLPVPPPDFAGALRVAARSLLQVGELSLAGAAEAAGTSTRSLQRRLAERGLRFTEIVDDVRFTLACELLRDPGARIVEVAAEVGYSDSANFTRAFRRWAGVSPRAYRRGLSSYALAS